MKRSWRRSMLPLVGLFLINIVAGAAHADWPQFRGPTGMGVSTEKNLPLTWDATKNVVWKATLPGVGTSSPIVIGDKIFLTAFSGYIPGQGGGSLEQLRLHVLRLNRADGALVWNKTIEPKLPEQAKMRENHGYASATPVADGERVYAFFGKSGVMAFTHDGEEVWRASVGTRLVDGYGCGASPILAGDLLIVNASFESDSLVALDKRTGKEVWKATGMRESWNTPVLVDADGKKELIVAIQGKVLAFEPATGERLWSCNTDIGWYMVPSVVAQDGVIGCLGGRSGVAALAVRAGGKGEVTASHRLWKANKGTNVSSPIVHDGNLYWVNDARGVAYCADLKTGRVHYEEELPRAGEFYASPVLAEGRIYYLTRDGRTFVVAAKPAFELLATNSLGERRLVFNASPAVAGGRIYIRVNQWLYALGER